mgnify:FL=1
MNISVSGVSTFILRGVIRLYQLVISPALGPRCRYLPTCSDYAMEALERHGPLSGAWLTTKRLARCHPWGGSGLDPVPDHLEHKNCSGAHDCGHTSPRTIS